MKRSRGLGSHSLRDGAVAGLLIFLSGMTISLASMQTDYARAAASPAAYEEVCRVVWQYISATESPDKRHELNRLLDPVWHGKFIDERNGLRVVDRQSYLQQPESATNGAPPSMLEPTDIQIHYGDFAIARLDDRRRATTHFLTLFKHGDEWRIANETRVQASAGRRDEHFRAENSAASLYQALENYYRAVEEGTPRTLEALFHSNWHMKNPDEGKTVSEDKSTFIARLERGPSAGYWNDRQVTDATIVYDRLALVRVDKPATRSSTMFTFMREDGVWVMIDKAWANPVPLEVVQSRPEYLESLTARLGLP